MTAVGSPAWVTRTNGALSARDQLHFAFAVHGSAVARVLVRDVGVDAEYAGRVVEASA